MVKRSVRGFERNDEPNSRLLWAQKYRNLLEWSGGWAALKSEAG